jgi:predicted DNA-binding transcriptional regulator YafY
MLETSARLLRLLTLLQARRYWPGAELADRLGVNARTLRRDVDRLRTLGYPVSSSTGPAGGYMLGAGASLPPLLLEEDEVLAVALGLRLAMTAAATGMEEAGLRALAKLEQMMPARLRKRIRGLHAAVTPLTTGGPVVDMDRLSTLAGACRDETCVAFGYEAQDGKRSTRDVEPHALVCSGERWYLLGWDGQREDWRTFRVDRMVGRITCAARFVPRPVPGGDPAAYVARAVSTTQYPVRARLVLHAPLRQMAEHIPPLAGRLEVIDEERCQLETGAQSAEILAAHLSLLGVGFEVLEPPELVGQLRRMATRLSRAARASQEGPRGRKVR